MRRFILATALLGALVFAGCGDSSSDSGGPPDEKADLVVKAEGGLKFDSPTYTAAAGAHVIELKNDDSMLHTLVIDGVKGFKLRVSSRGDADRDSVDLEAGTYELYCDVPGHQSGGMEATLTVS